MSYVNKVSKNNVEYDINDSRTFVLDLGDVTEIMDESGFQKSISGADLVSLVNADVGIVKFFMDGMSAECRVVAKGGDAENGYQAMATLFLQTEEDGYTTIALMFYGTLVSAGVQAYNIQQDIGGGSGEGVALLVKSLDEWIEDSDNEYLAEFSVSESDFETCTTNDFVVLKAYDYDTQYGEYYVMTKTHHESSNDGESVMFAGLADNRIYMAIIMKYEDEDNPGEYLYYAMAGKLPLQEPCTKLYTHYVQIDMGGGQGATMQFVNASSSEVDDLSSLMTQLGADATHTIQIILNGQKYSIVGVNYDANNQADKIVQLNGTSLAEISLSAFTGGTFTDTVNIINN